MTFSFILATVRDRYDRPSFKGMALFAIDYIISCDTDVECLDNLNHYFRQMSVTCSPCLLKYEAILKVSPLSRPASYPGYINNYHQEIILFQSNNFSNKK